LGEGKRQRVKGNKQEAKVKGKRQWANEVVTSSAGTNKK